MRMVQQEKNCIHHKRVLVISVFNTGESVVNFTSELFFVPALGLEGVSPFCRFGVASEVLPPWFYTTGYLDTNHSG